MTCLFPQNTPRTGYNKGCRCERCKEARAKRKAEYYVKNKEAIAKQKAEYYVKNKEAIAKQKAEYRAKNKEAIAEYWAEYRAKNKEAIAARDRKRLLWYWEEGRCYKCGKTAMPGATRCFDCSERGRRYL